MQMGSLAVTHGVAFCMQEECLLEGNSSLQKLDGSVSCFILRLVNLASYYFFSEITITMILHKLLILLFACLTLMVTVLILWTYF